MYIHIYHVYVHFSIYIYIYIYIYVSYISDHKCIIFKSLFVYIIIFIYIYISYVSYVSFIHKELSKYTLHSTWGIFGTTSIYIRKSHLKNSHFHPKGSSWPMAAGRWCQLHLMHQSYGTIGVVEVPASLGPKTVAPLGWRAPSCLIPQRARLGYTQ